MTFVRLLFQDSDRGWKELKPSVSRFDRPRLFPFFSDFCSLLFVAYMAHLAFKIGFTKDQITDFDIRPAKINCIIKEAFRFKIQSQRDRDKELR